MMRLIIKQDRWITSVFLADVHCASLTDRRDFRDFLFYYNSIHISFITIKYMYV